MHNRVDIVQTCYNLDLGPSKHDEDRVGSVQVVYTSVYRYRCSLSTETIFDITRAKIWIAG